MYRDVGINAVGRPQKLVVALPDAGRERSNPAVSRSHNSFRRVSMTLRPIFGLIDILRRTQAPVKLSSRSSASCEFYARYSVSPFVKFHTPALQLQPPGLDIYSNHPPRGVMILINFSAQRN